MAVYLITYDLNKEVVRPKILDLIKTAPWCSLSESSYAISTTLSADQIYENFKPMLDKNDYFTVLALSRPMSGWNNTETADWLSKHLPA